MFRAFTGWKCWHFFLNTTVFRDFQDTKPCNAQKLEKSEMLEIVAPRVGDLVSGILTTMSSYFLSSVLAVGLSRPCQGEFVPTPCAAGFGLGFHTSIISCFPSSFDFLRDPVLCGVFP